MRELPPLIVFSDDWGRHPSSCQHLVRRMLGERTVLWVNTIGTRRPRLCLADARRGVQKLSEWITPTSEASGGPAPIILNPLMWPDCSGALARALNARLIARCVRRAMRRHLHEQPVVLTTVPLTAPLVGLIPAQRWIYYCVDDWSTWPGLDHATLGAMETHLLASVDATAAVSEPLAAHLRSRGHEPMLLTHGVDLRMWAEAAPIVDDPVLRRLAALPRPLNLFWGLVDGKLDADALRRLAAQTPGSIALLGPLGENADAITGIAGVTHLPAVAHRLLPSAAHLADALLMPYRADHPALIASQPLKLMEYLATDRPVISTNLPAARRFADCCDIVAAAGFAERVMHRLSVGVGREQLVARRMRLVGESWDAKAAMLRLLIDGQITSTHTRGAA